MESNGSSIVESLLGAIQRRQRPKLLDSMVVVTAIAFSVFHLVTGAIGLLEPFKQRLISLSLIMAVGYLLQGRKRRQKNEKSLGWIFVDFLPAMVTLGCAVYFWVNYFQLVTSRAGEPTTIDIVVGSIYIVLLLEITRRVLGNLLVALISFFVVQPLFASHFTGLFGGPSVSWDLMVYSNVLTDFGVFGLPMGVVASFLVIFMVFVGFALRCGAAEAFLELATAVAGRYSGGPAKVAVVGSGLLGTVSGSVVANVVGTGSVTIPMMKRLGYKPHFAGAVEAVASTGGIIMPPIMGGVAFLMAQFLQVSYFRIVIAAAIPAILYYAAAFLAVHFEAKKLNLTGLQKEQLPSFPSALKRSWFIIIPFAVLLFLLGIGFGMAMCGLGALLILLFTSSLRKKTRLSLTSFLAALEESATDLSLSVGIACGSVGLLIGSFYITGFGNHLGNFIVNFTGGNLLSLLFVAMIFSLILGMAVTATAVYITLLLTVIPPMIALGVNPLAAHFFCFWYSTLCNITPPVALGVFAAMGIAGSTLWPTGLSAMRIALPIYFIPFIFIYHPFLLGFWNQASAFEIFVVSIKICVGIFAFAVGAANYFLRPLSRLERISFIISALFLLIPELITDIIGGVIFVITLIYHIIYQYIISKANLEVAPLALLRTDALYSIRRTINRNRRR